MTSVGRLIEERKWIAVADLARYLLAGWLVDGTSWTLDGKYVQIWKRYR